MYRPQKQETTSLVISGKLLHRALPEWRPLQQATVINTIGVLLMMTLVFVTATLMLLKKRNRRNSYSSVTLRYCRNGGQTFQLIPPSAATTVTNELDHNGRNSRM